MARLLQFFQLLLAELGAARRRGRGWSVGVVLLVLVLGEVPAYVRPLLAGLDASEDVEVLERLAVSVVVVHVKRPPHLQRQAGESKLGDPGLTETASKHTLASKSVPLTERSAISSCMPCHLLHAACIIPQCVAMAFPPRIITVLLK
jgi:hypothetical protein